LFHFFAFQFRLKLFFVLLVSCQCFGANLASCDIERVDESRLLYSALRQQYRRRQHLQGMIQEAARCSLSERVEL